MNAYLEFDAQPATMTPYTPMDVIAIMNNKLASTLANTFSGVNGMTAHATKAGASDKIGAMMNRYLLDPDGMTISFINIFSTSANGCSNPRGPTRFGPTRTCMKPITLRSK